MKLLVIGHGRSGKDELGRVWKKHYPSFSYDNSSAKACEIFIFDKLKGKYGYKTIEECYYDRRNHRSEWFDLIADYNSKDPARLAKQIVADSDAYFGMRRTEELLECKRIGLFDLIIGVDALSRVGTESVSSMDIDIWKHSDVIIDNNYDIPRFHERCLRLGRVLFGNIKK